MTRTITTVKLNLMQAQPKDDGTGYDTIFTDRVMIADSVEEAKKAFKKLYDNGIIIGADEPKTALYKMDDYFFLDNAKIVVKNDEKTAE